MKMQTPASVAPLERALDRQATGGPDAPVIAAVLPSPVGALVAAATDSGLCLLEFGEERRLTHQLELLARAFGPVRPGGHPVIERARTELDEYFAGRRREFLVPLAIRGTSWQELVWRALLAIPYGATRAYGDVAQSLGRPRSQRAVGLANGQNRLAIIIPCHRVIERSGGLRGYGGGLWRKQFLLDLERRVAGVDPLAGTPLGETAR